MRNVQAHIRGFPERTVLRAVSLQEMASQWMPNLKYLVRAESLDDYSRLMGFLRSHVNNIALLTPDEDLFNRSELPCVLEYRDKLEDGDVVAVNDERMSAHVLFRESDIHHTVFLTNRCNSNCLMCSQPPTQQDDSWLIEEAIRISSHMRITPRSIGFTGGEPLLLGTRLRDVFKAFLHYHPGVEFDLLTNGRLLSDQVFSSDFFAEPMRSITWMVPLYGHADFLHDFVVQSHGAFDQTINGLLTLQRNHQPIQLRIVLIKPVLEILPKLCEFIIKNLPFVHEVALMGCEPIGFALANRQVCEVDLKEWWDELEDGVSWLHRGHLKTVLMNMPLCSLPNSLWPYAHRSISDWKQAYATECKSCTVINKCSGLFSWHEKGWRPTTIKALQGGY